MSNNIIKIGENIYTGYTVALSAMFMQFAERVHLDPKKLVDLLNGYPEREGYYGLDDDGLYEASPIESTYNPVENIYEKHNLTYIISGNATSNPILCELYALILLANSNKIRTNENVFIIK